MGFCNSMASSVAVPDAGPLLRQPLMRNRDRDVETRDSIGEPQGRFGKWLRETTDLGAPAAGQQG